MSKQKNLKHRLRSDPDGMLAWMDGGYLPRMSYESAEITGVQLSMMLEGHDDVYILSVLPGDEYGQWMLCKVSAGSRRWGSTPCSSTAA